AGGKASGRDELHGDVRDSLSTDYAARGAPPRRNIYRKAVQAQRIARAALLLDELLHGAAELRDYTAPESLTATPCPPATPAPVVFRRPYRRARAGSCRSSGNPGEGRRPAPARSPARFHVCGTNAFTSQPV